MHWLLGRSAAGDEGLIEFLAHLGDDRTGVESILAAIDLPQRRMFFDFCVETRLRDGGVIHFAVAMAAEADQIDHHITRELCAIIGGNFPHADNGIGVLSIDVKNRNGLPLRQIRGET